VGFEPTISASEQAIAVYALDLAPTVTGHYIHITYFFKMSDDATGEFVKSIGCPPNSRDLNPVDNHFFGNKFSRQCSKGSLEIRWSYRDKELNMCDFS
jgi:hypothetical protein